jgi:hypothetical protein
MTDSLLDRLSHSDAFIATQMARGFDLPLPTYRGLIG